MLLYTNPASGAFYIDDFYNKNGQVDLAAAYKLH